MRSGPPTNSRFTRARYLGCALLLAGTACAASDPGGTDLILSGGVVRVGDLRTGAEAIAIDGDHIVRVGTLAEVRATATDTTQEMELEGAAVLPGLVDAWIDLEALGRWSGSLDLSRAASAREVLASIRAAPTDARGWVVGWGWDETLWPVSTLPDRSALDPLGSTPTVLHRRIGEVAWLNTAAIEAAGLANENGHLDGIFRDETGRPTGIVTGAALRHVRTLQAPPTRAQRREWFESGARAAAAVGITTVITAPLDAMAVDLLRELDSTGDFPIRVEIRLRPDVPAPNSARTGTLVSIRGYGLAVDGPLRPALAALSQPDVSGDGGDIVVDDDLVRDLCGRAADAGLVLDIRAHGDRAVTSSLAACPRLAEGIGWIVGGDVWPDDLDSSNPNVVGIPLRMTHDLYWIDDLLGPLRAARAHSYRTLLASGWLAGFASAAPEHALDTTAWLLALSTRRDSNGYPLDGWNGDQRISVGDALRVATSFTRPIGNGEPAADLAVWSGDPFDPEAKLKDLRVMLTLVAGRVVYSRPLVDVPFDMR